MQATRLEEGGCFCQPRVVGFHAQTKSALKISGRSCKEKILRISHDDVFCLIFLQLQQVFQ